MNLYLYLQVPTLLALLIYTFTPTAANNDDSSAQDEILYSLECPCIDPWIVTNATSDPGACSPTCGGANSRCVTFINSTGSDLTGKNICVPENYGALECKSWNDYDGFQQEECQGDTPEGTFIYSELGLCPCHYSS